MSPKYANETSGDVVWLFVCGFLRVVVIVVVVVVVIYFVVLREYSEDLRCENHGLFNDPRIGVRKGAMEGLTFCFRVARGL